MGVDDSLLTKALCTGSSDAVHTQCINHGGTDVTGHAAQRGERHDDQGQRHIVQFVQELLHAHITGTRCLHAAGREPAQLGAEQPDEQDADDEGRKAVAKDRQHLNRIIKFIAAFHCADNTQRDRNTQTKYGCPDIDLDRVDHWILNNFDNRLLGIIGVAEVTLQQTVVAAVIQRVHTYPAQIADELIIRICSVTALILQIQLVKFLINLILRDHAFQSFDFIGCIGISTVAGNKAVNQIHNHGQDNQNHKHIRDSFNNIFSHSLSSFRCEFKRSA